VSVHSVMRGEGEWAPHWCCGHRHDDAVSSSWGRMRQYLRPCTLCLDHLKPAACSQQLQHRQGAVPRCMVVSKGVHQYTLVIT
jgi:hypothetical protein